MSDVTLSASVRQSLLSLQSTTDLIERTQNRLSTGLRVSSAIDDPVAFFQGKSLSDRASDFLEKKDAIDQGISTVTGALDGVDAIESLVQQMKGISNSMKSATDAQLQDLVSQFNDLRTQIDNLAADASYQGTNLINGTGQTLSVEFSEKSSSLLNVSSVNIRSETAGLNIVSNAGLTGDNSVTHATIGSSTTTGVFAGGYLSAGTSFSLTYQASDKTFSAGETIAFTYGTGSSINLRVATGQSLTVAQNGVLAVSVVTSTTAISSTGLGIVGSLDNINASFTQTAAVLTQTSASADTTTISYNGTTTVTLTSADTLAFTFGTGADTLRVAAGTTLTLTAGEALIINVLATGASVTQGAANSGLYVTRTSGTGAGGGTGNDITASTGTLAVTGAALVKGLRLGSTAITANAGEITFTGLVRAGDTTQINAVIDQLDSALTTLRTQAQTLGSNVALLNARLSFTESYVNTLQGGSDKLTLADINSEGANLLALQTRQQLGIQSLSLAAQAEASILSLFG